MKLRYGMPIILLLLLAQVVVADEDTGKQLYEQKCLMCHGEKGDAQKALGVDFSSSEFWKGKSDEEIKEVIKNGKDGMPPFPDLSEDELSDLVEYLKSLVSAQVTTPTPTLTPTQVPTPTPTPTAISSPTPSQPTLTPTPTPTKITKTPEKRTPGMELVLALIAIMIVLYITSRKN